MHLFHTRLERLKMTCYSLISKFSINFLKLCLFLKLAHFTYLSSQVFAALQFDSNYFGALL